MQQIIFYLVLMEKELHPKIIVRGWVVSSIVLVFVIGQCLCSQTVEHEVEFDPLNDGQRKSSIIVPIILPTLSNIKGEHM